MTQERSRPAIQWSAADRARHIAIREWFQALRPTLDQLRGTQPFAPPVTLDTYIELRKLIQELKAIRDAAGLSLTDLTEKFDIDPASLTLLESGVPDNPTAVTLMRYAAALGKHLTWSLQDLPPDAK